MTSIRVRLAAGIALLVPNTVLVAYAWVAGNRTAASVAAVIALVAVGLLTVNIFAIRRAMKGTR
jgi:hypothetical protein